MAWLYLVLAGIFEIGWAISLKYTAGFTRFWPSVCMVGTAVVSFYCLSAALKTIPVGTTYVIFTGIGAIGTVAFGILFLGESRDILRIACIGLIIIGTLGLKFAGE
jgi:quaternary ammonium compound-resistance protein SugE